MKKSDLLVWLQDEYGQWEALLDEIGPSRMEQPGVNGDWSMKDMVAHLTGWNRWLVTQMQAVLRGEPDPLPPWPVQLQTDDEINAWIYQANRGRSVGDILDESRQVFHELFAVIGDLPEDVRIEKIEPKFYLVWVNDNRFEAGEFFDHYHDDHEPDVRAWLARVEIH
ncbi:MAG TPA: ClbS/DfsB family four-helix bundle protein [Anaerolineales bacterium]